MKSEIKEYQHLEASEEKKREREKTRMREKRSDITRISRSREQSTINVGKIRYLVDSTIEK